MPDAVMIDFRGPGMDEGLYDQVNQRVNPPDNPPEGLIFHSAGPLPGGGWRIVDVWESRDVFESRSEISTSYWSLSTRPLSRFGTSCRRRFGS